MDIDREVHLMRVEGCLQGSGRGGGRVGEGGDG